MTTVTVLGAGAMGSAICNPLVKAGWTVRLWGTWFDDHLIDAIDNQDPHPRTGAVISSAVETFRSDNLAAALEENRPKLFGLGVLGAALLAILFRLA